MRQATHPVKMNCSHVVEVEKADVVQQNVLGAISKKTIFRNGTRFHIKVTERSGLSFVVPPENPGSFQATGSFAVDVYYNYSHNRVIMDPDGMTNIITDADIKERVALRNSLRAAKRSNFDSVSVGTSYIVDGKEFSAKNSDKLYIEALDIVISIYISGNPTDVIHPHSVDGNIILSNVSDVEFFKYQIEIFDPRNRIGNRYINVGGKVHTVPVSRNSNKPEGVYVTSITGAGINNVDVEFYTLEEACELPFLHRSYDEADAFGSDTAAIKRAHELRVLNHKGDIAEKDERKSIIDEVMSQLKHQRDLDSLYEKDRYDRRSSERRDFAELLKWLPIVISLVSVFINKPSK